MTKITCKNSFELNILPFLGLHLVLNVELHRPYFPSLLNPWEVEEYVPPMKFNIDYIE
jgi:hypothetical protein